MTRVLRWAGAVVALFALLAMPGAGEASASTAITANNEGEGNHVFSASGFSAECRTVTAAGTAEGSTESKLTLHPTYSGCNSSLGSASVDSAGCNYVFSAATSSGHGKTEIECATGSAIKITAPGCTLSFAPQTAGAGVVYANAGSGAGRDITAKLTATLTFSKSGFGCFAISGNSGTYTGSLTMKGYRDEGGPSGERRIRRGCPEGLLVGSGRVLGRRRLSAT
jgi:hypothetical protein